MNTELTDKVYDYWRQSNEKFDYYVTGITGALCAYISQTFKVDKISVSPNTLELFSFVVLIASVYAGFKRIGCAIEVLRHTHSSFYLSDQIDTIASKPNDTDLGNGDTGEIIPPERVNAMVNGLKDVQITVKKSLEITATVGDNWYVWRNRLLFAGFLMLVISKIWSAYK